MKNMRGGLCQGVCHTVDADAAGQRSVATKKGVFYEGGGMAASPQKAVPSAALPEVGGRHGLQAGQDGRGALLQMVDGHEHVAVARQGAAVAVVHLQRIGTGGMRLCLSPLPES